MPLDETDFRLGKLDPNNTPSMRAERVLKEKISKLEREVADWKFVLDTLQSVKVECEN